MISMEARFEIFASKDENNKILGRLEQYGNQNNLKSSKKVTSEYIIFSVGNYFFLFKHGFDDKYILTYRSWYSDRRGTPSHKHISNILKIIQDVVGDVKIIENIMKKLKK